MFPFGMFVIPSTAIPAVGNRPLLPSSRFPDSQGRRSTPVAQETHNWQRQSPPSSKRRGTATRVVKDLGWGECPARVSPWVETRRNYPSLHKHSFPALNRARCWFGCEEKDGAEPHDDGVRGRHAKGRAPRLPAPLPLPARGSALARRPGKGRPEPGSDPGSPRSPTWHIPVGFP